MFIHSENVTHDVRSGLRSAAHGILLLVFDPFSNHEDSARISRCQAIFSPAALSITSAIYGLLTILPRVPLIS